MNTLSHRHMTASGGEPAEQAPALSELIDTARRERDWIVTCYSGYSLESLRRNIRPGTAALLDRLDLLIDGPYLVEQHASLLWRGSSNQRIHNLSGRVDLPLRDESVGVTPVISRDGSVEFIGVYPERETFDHLVNSLRRRGTLLSPSTSPRSFPFRTHKEL